MATSEQSFSSRFVGITFLLVAGESYGEEDILNVYGDEQMISIATGYRQPLAQAPAVASVVTADQIEAIGATTLEEVLETVLGLHVSTARGISPVFIVRGFFHENNAQVLMLINGIQVNDVVNAGRPQAWTMPVQNIARIEIVRGPGSAVYGADAFAGTINIVTKAAQEIDGTQTGAFGGSFDTYGGWLLHGKQYGDLEVAMALQGRTTDGDNRTLEADDQTRLDSLTGTSASLAPGPVNTQRDDLDARIDIAYGDRWRFRAGYQGFLNVGTGVGTALALDPGGELNVQLLNADFTFNWPSSEQWDIGAQVSYLHTDTNSKLAILPPGAFGGAFPEGVRNNFDFQVNQIRAGFTGLFHGLPKHRLRFGGGFNYADLTDFNDKRNFVIDPSGALIPTGVFADTEALGVAPSLVERDRKIHYGFVQDEWEFARDWTLTAGVRFDHYSDFGSTVNPRLSLVWEAAPTLTLKALYGRAFRPPSFIELNSQNPVIAIGDPNLDPETINVAELAAIKSWGVRHLTSLNVFGFQTDDLIFVESDPSIPSSPSIAFNTKGTRGYGLEFEWDYKATRDIDLSLKYAFQQTEDRITGENGSIAPQQQLYAQMDWRIFSNWHLNGRLKWIGKRERLPRDARRDIDDYVLLGLTMRKTNIKKRWEIALSLNNLLDEDAREPTLFPEALPFDIPMPGGIGA